MNKNVPNELAKRGNDGASVPISTIIVDDEPLAIRRMLALCAQLPILHVVGTANDGIDAMELIKGIEPELVFLDISMPGMSGVEVAEECLQLEKVPAVVFTTAYSHFAVQAFGLDAIDYLLKPVKQERLFDAAKRAIRRKVGPNNTKTEKHSPSRYVQHFLISHGNAMIQVLATDIEQIDAERDYMKLHVGEHIYYLHQSMKATEDCLDPAKFVRVHRSTIVRIDKMKQLRKDGRKLILQQSDGTEVQVGPSYAEKVEQLIFQN